jgi:hypothetical protein
MPIAERFSPGFVLVGGLSVALGAASVREIEVGAPQMPEPTETVPGPELDVLPPWLDSLVPGDTGSCGGRVVASSDDDYSRVLVAMAPELRTCFLPAGGHVRMILHIDASGHVLEARPVEGARELGDCVAAVLRDGEFPAAAPVMLSVPITATPCH